MTTPHHQIYLGDGISAQVLDVIPVLPYWPMYDVWRAHLESCPECTRVMTEQGGMIPDMCPEGQPLAQAASDAVEDQHYRARNN